MRSLKGRAAASGIAWAWAFWGFLLLWSCGFAQAHQGGSTYLSIVESDGAVRVELDVSAKDVEKFLALPTQAAALQPSKDAVERMAQATLSRMQLEWHGKPLKLLPQGQGVAMHADGIYLRLSFLARVPNGADWAQSFLAKFHFGAFPLEVDRVLLRLVSANEELAAVANSDSPIQRLVLGPDKTLRIVRLFLMEGVRHILSGWDHQLFVISLLLPILLARAATQSHAAARPLMQGIQVVTAFTVAHSITLTMAALNLIGWPDKWIESVIAGSILVSALLNLQTKVKIRLWLIALGFGLVHGMGFANGLKALGLSAQLFVESMIAFNLGVELGQIAVVGVVWGVVVLLIRSERTKGWLLTYGSLAIALVAAVWLAQRLAA